MWRPLSLGDIPTIQRLCTNNSYRLSDYSLPSLLAWSLPQSQTFFRIISDIPLFLSKRAEEDFLFLPFCHKNITASLLSSIAIDSGVYRFCTVPEEVIGEDFEQFFTISEDKKNANYIYRAEDLSLLRGNKFIAKRNHINGFIKTYAHQGIETAPISAATAAECLLCLEEWRQEKISNGYAEDILLAEECLAVQNALQTIDSLNWHSILVRVKEKVCGFAIGSRITDDTFALNFEKALLHYRGLYQFLDREFARSLASTYEYINKEGDMGIAGLKNSKESYHPVAILPSYSLFLREKWKKVQHNPSPLW